MTFSFDTVNKHTDPFNLTGVKFLHYIDLSKDFNFACVFIEPEDNDKKVVFAGVNEISHERIVVVVKFVWVKAEVYEIFVETSSKLFQAIEHFYELYHHLYFWYVFGQG